MSRRIRFDVYTDEEKKRFINETIGFYSNESEYIYHLENAYYEMSRKLNEYEKLEEKVKRLQHEKHMYKVELGRCVRKLTRIYETVYNAGFLGYVMGISDITARESVDTFKRM